MQTHIPQMTVQELAFKLRQTGCVERRVLTSQSGAR